MTALMSARPPERLETERLVLRVPTLADAPAMFANYASDPEVTKYLTWTPHPSVKETERVLTMLIGMWDSGTSYPWAITIDDEIVGMIEAAIKPPSAEFGWVLSRRRLSPEREQRTTRRPALLPNSLTQTASWEGSGPPKFQLVPASKPLMQRRTRWQKVEASTATLMSPNSGATSLVVMPSTRPKPSRIGPPLNTGPSAAVCCNP